MLLKTPVEFSYSQILIFDKSVQLPGCAWTAQHSAQGFARRESALCIGTILELGLAQVSVIYGKYPSTKYQRLIAVPFKVLSGCIVVEGPEEMNTERVIYIESGDYRLSCGQKVVIPDEEIALDLYFEQVAQPLQSSSVIIADHKLRPRYPLLESSEIAGD